MENQINETKEQTIVRAPNNLPYVIAVVLMMLIAIVGVIAVSVFRPGKDNIVIVAAIFGFLTPTTLSLLAFMKSQETHLSVNSRLDAFMTQAKSASMAQGEIIGRRQANERTDQLSGAGRAG